MQTLDLDRHLPVCVCETHYGQTLGIYVAIVLTCVFQKHITRRKKERVFVCSLELIDRFVWQTTDLHFHRGSIINSYQFSLMGAIGQTELAIQLHKALRTQTKKM